MRNRWDGSISDLGFFERQEKVTFLAGPFMFGTRRMGNVEVKVKAEKDFVIMQKVQSFSQRSQLRGSMPGYDQGYQLKAMGSGGIVGRADTLLSIILIYHINYTGNRTRNLW